MRTVTGTGYSLFYDDEGRYVFGSGVANPTVRSAFGTTGVVIPEGGFFYRNDLGYGLYNVAGTWTVLSPTQGAVVATSVTSSGGVSGTTGSFSSLLSALAGAAFGNATGTMTIGIGESGTKTADAGGSATLSYTGGLPARSVILGVIVRTTTAFSGNSVNKLQVGDGSAADRFRATPVAATAQHKVIVALDHLSGTSVAASQAAAGDVVVTFFAADGTTPASPTAGALRITVIYAQFSEAASASYV